MKGKTFIEVQVLPHCGAHTWSVEELDNVELVFDGGDKNNHQTEKPVHKKINSAKVQDNKPWRSVRTSAGQLFVADTN